jgi:hypothetical protein
MEAVHAGRDHPVQDVSQQLKTYRGFLMGLRYVVLNFMVVASFLILAFCTGAGFWGGAFVAFVVLAIGLFFARDRKKLSWESEFGALFISTSAESGHEIEDMVRAEGGHVPGDPPPTVH